MEREDHSAVEDARAAAEAQAHALRGAEEVPAPPGADADAEQAIEEQAPDRDDGGHAGAGDDVEQDLEQLIVKSRERDEYLALAQRTQADFENYRRRMARDVAVAEKRGMGKLAREFLPALDNLELAISAAESSGDGPTAAAEASEQKMAEGVRLIHAELMAALGRVGIESFSPHGEAFDPEQHEAMAQQRVEGVEPGTIVDVFQSGYRLGPTILRPARVLVAQ